MGEIEAVDWLEPISTCGGVCSEVCDGSLVKFAVWMQWLSLGFETLDLVTDWVNYGTFVSDVKDVLLICCIVASVLYFIQVICWLFFLLKSDPHTNYKAGILLNLVFGWLIFFFEDLPISFIYYNALKGGSCPMFVQVNTTPGIIALVVTFVSVSIKCTKEGLGVLKSIFKMLVYGDRSDCDCSKCDCNDDCCCCYYYCCCCLPFMMLCCSPGVGSYTRNLRRKFVLHVFLAGLTAIPLFFVLFDISQILPSWGIFDTSVEQVKFNYKLSATIYHENGSVHSPRISETIGFDIVSSTKILTNMDEVLKYEHECSQLNKYVFNSTTTGRKTCKAFFLFKLDKDVSELSYDYGYYYSENTSGATSNCLSDFFSTQPKRTPWNANARSMVNTSKTVCEGLCVEKLKQRPYGYSTAGLEDNTLGWKFTINCDDCSFKISPSLLYMSPTLTIQQPVFPTRYTCGFSNTKNNITLRKEAKLPSTC